MKKDFDVIVLTAANEAQAAGYRAQLAWRRERGLIPAGTRTLVLADPGGRRVGSFTATLNVLAHLVGPDGRVPKTLVCHSGGDSRRTPAYAAQGKAFTPMPCRDAGGNPLALFDLIARNAAELPIEAGVLVASGDVVLTFGDGDLAAMDFSGAGVTGVGYRDTPAQGSRHGVYVAGPDGRVDDFLQKPDEAAARRAGAIGDDGLVAVDTGLVLLDPATCRLLAEIARTGVVDDAAAGRCPQMDLYEEFLMAIVPSLAEEAYLARFSRRAGFDDAHASRLRAIRARLRATPFRVCLAKECDFFHIGSSRELLSGFTGDSLTARLYGFAAGRQRGPAIDGDGAFVFNSDLGSLKADGPALVEGCRFHGAIRLAGENIVTGLPGELAGALGDDAALSLPPGIGLVVLPVGETGWAAVAYGVADDFKTPFATAPAPGARPCLFLNRPVGEWLAARELSPNDLWRGDEAAGMWTARLWRVGALASVVAEAVAFAGGDVAPKTAPAPSFRASSRFSLSALVPQVSHERLLRGQPRATASSE